MAFLRMEISQNNQKHPFPTFIWYYAAATLNILYFVVKLEENTTAPTT